MNTIGGWLAAQQDLQRLDRELLVCEAAGLTRVQILSRPETLLEGAVQARLDTLAERRRRGEPIAYITGRKEFWGLALEVDARVLVPRPETELLVELGLAAVAGRPVPRVLELGTGSGAVAIALAAEFAALGVDGAVTASDVSCAALEVAGSNARRLGVDVRWHHGDWLQGLRGEFDLIVTNPPYVARDDLHLPDLRHEPTLALVSGDDGLDAIRSITAAAPGHLAAAGWLMLEHGSDQGAAVRNLLIAADFEAVDTVVDLAGLERVTRGRRRDTP